MKTFKFSNGKVTIEITALSYAEVSRLVPIGYELVSITKHELVGSLTESELTPAI